MRVVTSNSAFEQRNIHTVYAMARSQASKMLDAHDSSNDLNPIGLYVTTLDMQQGDGKSTARRVTSPKSSSTRASM